ncbi:hypothetical protein AYO44_02895 [Planctomycetaceae bacterium SCGC AG-212-F19]|nr:hypothetical protein AYO44_02895 [Planctomycetaceae bacterium SCGC AG-212-F19]
MGRFSINFRRDLGTYLFGLWLVLLGILSWEQIGLMSKHWVNVLMGVLLIIAGVFHLVEI